MINHSPVSDFHSQQSNHQGLLIQSPNVHTNDDLLQPQDNSEIFLDDSDYKKPEIIKPKLVQSEQRGNVVQKLIQSERAFLEELTSVDKVAL